MELEKPAFKDLDFGKSWVLWEHYETDMDFLNSLRKVAWFNDAITFS